MDLPVQEWMSAVPRRLSRRKFDGKKLDRNELERMNQICEGFRPFPEVRSVLVQDDSGRVFSGIVGSYGQVKQSPCYIAFIGDTREPNVEAQLGYTGEGIILEATALGLDTCWVAGFFDPKVVESDVQLSPGERVFGVTPLGYAVTKLNTEERMMRYMARSAKRKKLAAIAENWEADRWPAWAREGVKTARVAPSAVNRQPWLFRFEEGEATISAVGPDYSHNVSKYLDCGIAMLHFELGARAHGAPGRWEFLPKPEVARYILT